MIATIILCFLVGVWFGNGIPHFIRGITKQKYPSMLGNGPVPNLIAGWTAVVTTPLWLYWSQAASYPVAAWIAGALGILAIGLFHAGPGAFGKQDK